MDSNTFNLFVNRLNKNKSQLGELLGVSEKTITDYISGQRTVPINIERKLYFLLSRLRSEEVIRKPCWKINDCPREKKLKCPAWEFQSGAVCWLLNGTLCDDAPLESWREKWKQCKNCNVIKSIISPPAQQPLQQADLKYQGNTICQFEQIVGRDPKMQVVYKLIQDVAETKTTVMIQGESGTGKELVARAIHRLSSRKNKPFIVINCSAFPETLLESELFGHEKGSFTGAMKTRAGRFEQADGGTVFLDEIGDISPQAQVKLLRVLQTQKLKRLGGDQVISVDIRVITASNRNLKDLVYEKKFRADLFYRLNVIPIFLPALREKPNDIPMLAAHFLERYASEFGKAIYDFSSEAMRYLTTYNWPGNTRELEHSIEYAVALAKGNRIEANDLPGFQYDTSLEEIVTDESLEDNERRHIIRIMESVGWNKKEGAIKLGISRSTLYQKLSRYNITQP